MISLKQSVSELDQMAALLRGGLECHQNTVRLMAEYAIEVDADLAVRYREQIGLLGKRFIAANGAAVMAEVQRDLAEEARLYYEESTHRLGRLREDFGSAARALSELVSSITSNNDDHEKLLEDELGELAHLAMMADAAELRQGLQKTTARLTEYVKRIRADNRFVVAQLRDEIRTLQDQVQSLEHQTARPASAGNDRESVNLEVCARKWVDEGRSFCGLFFCLPSKGVLRAQSPSDDGPDLRTAVEAALPSSAKIGSWCDGVLCALAEVDKTTMLRISKSLQQGLAIRNDGAARVARMSAPSGVVDFRSGDSLPSFLHRAKSLIAALRASG